MSGSTSERVAVVTASARSLPLLMCSIATTSPKKTDLHLSGDQIGYQLTSATIGHVNHVDTGHHLEQLAGDVRHGSAARRRHVDFAGIGLGIGDELGNRLGRK